MGDEDHGLANFLLQIEKHTLHVHADQRIECREGLVHQQDRCVIGQGTCETDALLHSARKLVRIIVLEPVQADAGNPAPGMFFLLLARDSLDLEAVDCVFKNGTVGQKRELLEHHRGPVSAEFPEFGLVHLDHVIVADDDLAGRRIDQPVDVANQRGLAGARQAHDDLDAASGHVDIDVLEAEHVVVLLVELGLRHAALDGIDVIFRV